MFFILFRSNERKIIHIKMSWNDQDGLLCIYRKEVIVLFALGEILGSLIGTAGQNLFYGFFKGNRNSISFSIISKYYIFSFGFVAIAVIVAWVFMIRKIRYLSPMELFRKSYQKDKI